MFCRRSCPSGRILKCSAICFTGIILVNTKNPLKAFLQCPCPAPSPQCSNSLSLLLLVLSVLPFWACSRALGGSSQPWLSPCWIHTMDVHYAFMCVHPRLLLPQTNILTLFAFPETPSCVCLCKVQYFIRKPFSYLPCSLIWRDLCSLMEPSSLTSPGLSSFSTRHKKLTLLCISPSSAALQPPVYHLSMPDLPICPLTEVNAGVNLLF